MNLKLFEDIRVGVLEALQDMLPTADLEKWQFHEAVEEEGRKVTYYLGHVDSPDVKPTTLGTLFVDSLESSRRVRILSGGNTSHEHLAIKIAATLKPALTRAVIGIRARMQKVTLTAEATKLSERVTGDRPKVVLIGGEDAINGTFQIPPDKLNDNQALHDIVRALRALHKALAS